jgi:hypothetical protein
MKACKDQFKEFERKDVRYREDLKHLKQKIKRHPSVLPARVLVDYFFFFFDAHPLQICVLHCLNLKFSMVQPCCEVAACNLSLLVLFDFFLLFFMGTMICGCRLFSWFPEIEHCDCVFILGY